MGEKHKFEMNVNGETIKWEEKSYAQIFRNFWAYFMEKNLQKTIDIIELVKIRTSDSEYFISKNGSKKKNIHVKDDLWIYTHLTPKAMEKVYENFIAGWDKHYETLQPEMLDDDVQPLKKPKDEEKAKVKIIYKKSLAMDLIKRNHNFLYTTRNRNNPKYQCFMFEATEELDKDLSLLSNRAYDETMYSDKK
ncbi:hypothetical protein ABEW33_23360 [Priestia megaterium]|uniref:hypothetical protein n=1 Tax=Priestia megaterium TaxID=1404 RepID=UPI0030C956CA